MILELLVFQDLAHQDPLVKEVNLVLDYLEPLGLKESKVSEWESPENKDLKVIQELVPQDHVDLAGMVFLDLKESQAEATQASLDQRVSLDMEDLELLAPQGLQG